MREAGSGASSLDLTVALAVAEGTLDVNPKATSNQGPTCIQGVLQSLGLPGGLQKMLNVERSNRRPCRRRPLL